MKIGSCRATCLVLIGTAKLNRWNTVSNLFRLTRLRLFLLLNLSVAVYADIILCTFFRKSSDFEW